MRKEGVAMENKGLSMVTLTHFFRRRTFSREISGWDVPVYSKVVNGLYEKNLEYSNLDIIHDAYQLLETFYRNEYFYKNTLFNKLLLGVHSLNTTTALTELPVVSAKADFILINGKAVVFEIKTGLDNFERLDRQVTNYYKAFDHVALVTDIKNLNKVSHYPDLPITVGIYLLQENNRLKTIRKPLRWCKDLNKKAMFRILRKREYEDILLEAYHDLPSVPPVDYYKGCYGWFSKLPMEYIYPRFLGNLKNRSKVKNQNLFNEVPYELKSLVYFMNFSETDYIKLKDFLKRPARRN